MFFTTSDVTLTEDLLKYFFETHEDFSGEVSDKLMKACASYSNRKHDIKDAIGLADSDVKAEAFSDNLSRICQKYIDYEQL